MVERLSDEKSYIWIVKDDYGEKFGAYFDRGSAAMAAIEYLTNQFYNMDYYKENPKMVKRVLAEFIQDYANEKAKYFGVDNMVYVTAVEVNAPIFDAEAAEYVDTMEDTGMDKITKA